MIAGTPERCVVVRGTLEQVEAAERMLAERRAPAPCDSKCPDSDPLLLCRLFNRREEPLSSSSSLEEPSMESSRELMTSLWLSSCIIQLNVSPSSHSAVAPSLVETMAC